LLKRGQRPNWCNKLLHQLFRDTLKDEVVALRYHERAAELGSGIARDNIGTFYGMGRAMPLDKVRAMVWYDRAATHGFVPVMNNLGVRYGAQFQGKPDYCQVLEWFKKSAEGGNAVGMWHLGQAYQQGLCPQARNAKLARQWL
jgi:TPR repeat protein